MSSIVKVVPSTTLGSRYTSNLPDGVSFWKNHEPAPVKLYAFEPVPLPEAAKLAPRVTLYVVANAALATSIAETVSVATMERKRLIGRFLSTTFGIRVMGVA